MVNNIDGFIWVEDFCGTSSKGIVRVVIIALVGGIENRKREKDGADARDCKWVAGIIDFEEILESLGLMLFIRLLEMV